MYTAYFDGGLRQNKMTYGFVVYDDNNKKIYETGGVINEHNGTVNIAEYRGLQYLLIYLTENSIKRVNIYGDSQIIIYQILNRYKVTAKHLQEEHGKVLMLINNFDEINISWIPRENNVEADRMTRG